MQILENQSLMLNNLFMQNQAQMVFRERQLIMNSQFPAPMYVPPAVGYLYPVNYPLVYGGYP